jgi:hypothetical protein
MIAVWMCMKPTPGEWMQVYWACVSRTVLSRRMIRSCSEPCVEQIELTILRDSGLNRYAADSYFGGGEWILLTAWLRWYSTALIAKRPDRKFNLGGALGEIASPLLWSHASYIILRSGQSK